MARNVRINLHNIEVQIVMSLQSLDFTAVQGAHGFVAFERKMST